MVKRNFFVEPNSLLKVVTAEMHGMEKRLKQRKDSDVSIPFASIVARKENGEEGERMLLPPPAITDKEDTTCSFAIRPCIAETVNPQE